MIYVIILLILFLLFIFIICPIIILAIIVETSKETYKRSYDIISNQWRNNEK